MKKEVSKKVLIISLVVFLCLLICTGIIFFIFHKPQSGAPDKQYYVPNYEEDIFQNKAYITFQRDLRYSALGVEQLYNFEKDYEVADKECQFFLSYFDTVIRGDYENLPKFYADDFFDEAPKFTMQMIYEPYVLYHSTSNDKIDGEDVTLLNYHVEYKIFKNNGTFRPDVSSNTAIPQIYQLLKKDDGTYQIVRVLDVKVEK